LGLVGLAVLMTGPALGQPSASSCPAPPSGKAAPDFYLRIEKRAGENVGEWEARQHYYYGSMSGAGNDGVSCATRSSLTPGRQLERKADAGNLAPGSPARQVLQVWLWCKDHRGQPVRLPRKPEGLQACSSSPPVQASARPSSTPPATTTAVQPVTPSTPTTPLVVYDDQSAEAARLNRGVLDRSDAIVRRNGEAQADYERRQREYREALARQQAEAERIRREDEKRKREYEARMRAWRKAVEDCKRGVKTACVIER